tara:strand:- start:667 stop:888 length:222 start_codon:yes stop_codon:yes gene_type:complete
MKILILLGVMVGSVYFYETYVDKVKLTQDLSTIDIERAKKGAAELKNDAVFLYNVVERMKENKSLDSQDESEQ